MFDGGVEWEEDEWSELHNAHHELKVGGVGDIFVVTVGKIMIHVSDQ